MAISEFPGFIDAPLWSDDPAVWVAYRDDLARSGLPGVEVFIQEADENIRRLSPP
jgi:hypothetical protein